jgi:alpha-ketoglutarate-dependent taurine dioxygenase
MNQMENNLLEMFLENKTSLISDDNLVVKKSFNEECGQVLPLLIKPKNPGLNLIDWLNKNKDQFEKELMKHGGILLRGFGIQSAEDFNNFMKCFNTEPLPYMFRSSPRKELDKTIKNIYLSTSYPSNRSINMHNESSYSRIWGKKIVFCCIKPSLKGGETPLADCRRVINDIRPDLVEKFRTRGVKYRRNLLPDLGMSWQEVFQTDDINVAKATCAKYHIAYKFDNEEKFVIEWLKPAVYRHPLSNEETWFNHVLFFNKYSRYEELGLSSNDSIPDEYLTSDTFFGDGSEITYEEYLEIKNAYLRNLVVFPYEKGDILFLDNMLTAHGRKPYQGDRIIATAIIEAAFDDGY